MKTNFRTLENDLFRKTTLMHECMIVFQNFEPCISSSINLSKDFEYNLNVLPLTKLRLVSLALFLFEVLEA